MKMSAKAPRKPFSTEAVVAIASAFFASPFFDIG